MNKIECNSSFKKNKNNCAFKFHWHFVLMLKHNNIAYRMISDGFILFRIIRLRCAYLLSSMFTALFFYSSSSECVCVCVYTCIYICKKRTILWATPTLQTLHTFSCQSSTLKSKFVLWFIFFLHLRHEMPHIIWKSFIRVYEEVK